MRAPLAMAYTFSISPGIPRRNRLPRTLAAYRAGTRPVQKWRKRFGNDREATPIVSQLSQFSLIETSAFPTLHDIRVNGLNPLRTITDLLIVPIRFYTLHLTLCRIDT